MADEIDDPQVWAVPLHVVNFGDGRSYYSATWAGHKVEHSPRLYSKPNLRAELCVEYRRAGFLGGEVRLSDHDGVVERTRFTESGDDADNFPLPEPNDAAGTNAE